MRSRTLKSNTPRIVWRISDSAPLGEFVHIDDPASTAAKPQASPKPGPEEGQREHTGRGWHYSTHDLVRGTEVHEEPLDSLSDDLIDQLFRKP